VLGDRNAGGGANQRGGGGNIKCAETVTTGADNIENFAGLPPTGLERRSNGFVTQRTGERSDFTGRLAFLCQRDQKVGFDGRRNLFIGQLLHGVANLFVRKRLRIGQLVSEFFEHGTSLRMRNGHSRRKVHYN
jgi:hypothetical protein